MSRAERMQLAGLGIHPSRARTLLDSWGSAAAVLRAIRLQQVDVAAGVRRRLDWDVSAAVRSTGADVVIREEFPSGLRDLPDAPDLLFVRGAPLPTQTGVAIVGTRAATAYGLAVAERFGRAVANAGWPVVSGLARGIDGAAHRGCVDTGGSAIAVLGCGIDVCYPPEHGELLDRILAQGGSVATEYAPGAPPEGWRFPPRNRIISGLAGVVVVIEAGVKGGALITAACALEQGRAVLAVPGDIDRPTSRGCNLLIRDGAHPVLDVDDLITSLTFILGPPPAAGRADPIVDLVRQRPHTVGELAVALDATIQDVVARAGRLEALGLVHRKSDVVGFHPDSSG